jgi:simple sugar transport system permease protein
MSEKINTTRRKTKFKINISHLTVPLIALALLVIFNLIYDPSFFELTLRTNNFGHTVLSGNLLSVFNNASELAVLAIGMTLVTAACGGQDISVGAVAAIAGSVFIRFLKAAPEITALMIAFAFIAAGIVAILFTSFNGMLVAKFKIQPMIATLILFTTGRAIAYWISDGATPTVTSDLLAALGSFMPGVPIQTPIFIVILCCVLIALVLKFTNLGIYTQAVGINEKSAYLNGINSVFIKMLAFIILGVCVTVAGTLFVCRMGLMNNETLLLNIEMDAILAVAIGGNALGGGKFSITGSILGAYIIQGLTTTLYAMKVSSTDVKAYKAVVIVILVVMSSPIVKSFAAKAWTRLTGKKIVSGGVGNV